MTLKKMKSQVIHWEEIFSSHVDKKGLLSRTDVKSMNT